MKIIYQSEPSECGLACLAMIANYYGFKTTLASLRMRFSFSLKGARLSDLIKISHDLGFKTRALRIELNDLYRIKSPSILHWNLSHFVILVKASKKKITIIDPSRGLCNLSYSEVSRLFSGVMLELMPASNFVKKDEESKVSLSQVIGRIEGLVPSLIHLFFLTFVLQCFVVSMPFYMQWVIDHALLSSDTHLLLLLGIGFSFGLLIQLAISWLRGQLVIYLSSNLYLQWTGNVFLHLLKIPLDFFEKRFLCDITSRISSIQSIQQTLTTNFIEVTIDGLMALLTLVLMISYSLKLSIITIFCIIFYFTIKKLTYPLVLSRTEKQIVASSKQQGHILETLRGIQSLKVAGKEHIRAVTFECLTSEMINHNSWLARVELSLQISNTFIFGVEKIIVIWIGATLVLDKHLSIGMLIAYLAYKDQFTERMVGFINKITELRMLRIYVDRLSDIVLTQPETVSLNSYSISHLRDFDIEVKNLSFRYAFNDPYVLKDINFTIKAGESVAVTGPSGCGKTTLVKLLLGLLKPSSGLVRFGDYDLTKLSPNIIRSQIGVVMQDDQLFSGTIADNISFFESDFDYKRIEDSAKLAFIHDEIVSLPMGYNTLIGDMGSVLSGGQKQRVILARALYRCPSLLILDEATSHLDIDNEKKVNEALRNLNITKIIIAHRPETITSAKRVIFLGKKFVYNDSKSIFV